MSITLASVFAPRYPELVFGRFAQRRTQHERVRDWWAATDPTPEAERALLSFFGQYYQSGVFIPTGLLASKTAGVQLRWPEADCYYFKPPDYYPEYRWQLASGEVVIWRVSRTEAKRGRALDVRRQLVFLEKMENGVVHFTRRPSAKKQSQASLNKRQLPELAKLHNAYPATSTTELADKLHHFTHRDDTTGFVPKDLKNYLLPQWQAYVADLAFDRVEGSFNAEVAAIHRHGRALIELLSSFGEAERTGLLHSAPDTSYLIDRQRLERLLPGPLYRACWEALRADATTCAHWQARFGTVDHPKLPIRTAQLPGELRAPTHEVLAAQPDQLTAHFYHGDNLRAMRFFGREKLRVDAAYTDPPYNTGGDLFPYRDGYASGAWLSLMQDRLAAARALLGDGLLAISIGEEEVHHLKLLLQSAFGRPPINNIVVRRQDKNLSLQFVEKGLSSLAVGYEYVLLASAAAKPRVQPVYQNKEVTKRSLEGYWKGFWNGADRPTMRYPLLGAEIEQGQWKWKRETGEAAAANYLTYLRAHATRQSLADYWESTGRTLKFVRKNPKGAGKHRGIEHWVPPAATKLRTTNWTDQLVMRSVNQSLGLEFPSPKNPDLIAELLRLTGLPPDGTCLDFFAGSGSTYQAVQQLNAADGGTRRTVLVEQSDSFDRFLLERVMQLSFSPTWKRGTAVGSDGPGVFARLLRECPGDYR